MVESEGRRRSRDFCSSSTPPMFYISNISSWMNRALTCRADKVNLVHASAQSVPSCSCQNCHRDSFSLPYPPRPKTRKQVLLAGEKRQKEKVTAARSRRKSVKTAREGCRRGRWHFTCDETTQLITALPRWLHMHKHRKQVEIDHVAPRKQLPCLGSSSSAS